MRIGLLGGSFNPAHQGHRQISLAAMKRLGLDQVWWLVSPGNPLKATSDVPELGDRVASAREIARHPKIVVTGFEGARPKAARGSVYTIETIRFLKRRFPSIDFVWLMGADSLVSFHCWREWERGWSAADRRARPTWLPAEGSGRQNRAAVRFCCVDENPMRGGSRPIWRRRPGPCSLFRCRGSPQRTSVAVRTPSPLASRPGRRQDREDGDQEGEESGEARGEKDAKQAKKATKKSKKKPKRH